MKERLHLITLSVLNHSISTDISVIDSIDSIKSPFQYGITVESYHQFENNTIHGTLVEASLFLTYSISCSGLMVHSLYEVVTVFDSNSKYCDILLS